MRIRPSGRRVVSPGGQDSVAAWSMVLAARSGPRHAYTVPGSGGRCHAVDDPSIPWSPVLSPVLNIPRTHLKGLWCSGITSASHAEGPGLNPQQVHIATRAPHARLQYGKFFFSAAWTGSYLRKKLLHHQKTAACLDKSEEIAPHGPAAVSLQTCFFTATAVSLSPCPLRKPLSLHKKQLLRICYRFIFLGQLWAHIASWAFLLLLQIDRGL